jgi:hypothetical protein
MELAELLTGVLCVEDEAFAELVIAVGRRQVDQADCISKIQINVVSLDLLGVSLMMSKCTMSSELLSYLSANAHSFAA